MDSIFRKAMLSVAIVVAGAISSPAAIMIAYQDGSAGHNFTSWSISGVQGGPGTLAVGGGAGVAVGGNPSAGQITTTPGIAEVREDLIYAGVGSGFDGNYATGVGIGAGPIVAFSADFYAYDNVGALASDFRLYMLAGGNEWYYDVGPLVAGWQNIYVGMTYINLGVGWYNEGALTALDFQNDLATVTRIGFDLSYLVENELQTFGFDNIALYDNSSYVPEPETYLVLAVALASLAFMFREQVRQTLGAVRATVRG